MAASKEPDRAGQKWPAVLKLDRDFSQLHTARGFSGCANAKLHEDNFIQTMASSSVHAACLGRKIIKILSAWKIKMRACQCIYVTPQVFENN